MADSPLPMWHRSGHYAIMWSAHRERNDRQIKMILCILKCPHVLRLRLPLASVHCDGMRDNGTHYLYDWFSWFTVGRTSYEGAGQARQTIEQSPLEWTAAAA